LTIISGSIYISLQLTGRGWMIGDGLLEWWKMGTYILNYNNVVFTLLRYSPATLSIPRSSC